MIEIMIVVNGYVIYSLMIYRSRRRSVVDFRRSKTRLEIVSWPTKSCPLLKKEEDIKLNLYFSSFYFIVKFN